MLEGYLKFVRRFLPSPFSIAIILSIITFVVVLFYAVYAQQKASVTEVLNWWQAGLFTPSLLVFAVQMMLMLVLGHILALTPISDRIIQTITKHCDTTPKAAAIVAFSTLCVGLFNWGLGLIFGAILARKVGEKAVLAQQKINYPLVAAAGYAALMIWHGGLSGSALIKAAEPGHLAQLTNNSIAHLPDQIGLSLTVFSGMNLFATIGILLLVPMALYFLGKNTQEQIPEITVEKPNGRFDQTAFLLGAEKLDNSPWFLKSIGFSILAFLVFQMISEYASPLDFFTPNNINLLLFSLCLSSHQNMNSLLTATDQAIVGAGGILLQFPLYFGIMGLMRESGLVAEISQFFVLISNEQTFPLFTYLSAGLVNIFVPSGGGQWAIQGPILIQSSTELGVSLPKSILALAYGDQITNMLQPFWALPLLGITKLSARDILPFTLVMFLVGFMVYGLALILF
ncbi:MAG: TIGR00366 family protein [Salibacteraceae bacterium]|nr:TIGR00366 family protein [Salibacteraceae bacterium]